MNDLIERNSTLPADLATLSTDVLKRRLAEQMELSARHLVEMAAIWTELERRGENLSALRGSLTDYLPMIAAGELDAEAVVRYAGSRQLLRYLATLPLDRQRHLLDVGEVELVLSESGESTRRKLAHLTGREVTQVFGHGIVRSPREQARLMATKTATRRAQAKRSQAVPAVRIHYGSLEVEGEQIKVGGSPLRAGDLLEALSKHYGVDLAAAVAKGKSS